MKESVIYQEILREGLQEGLQAEVNLIVRQLTRRLGTVPQALQNQIQSLSIAQLEDLGEALLDFSSQPELENWLSDLERQCTALSDDLNLTVDHQTAT